MLPATTTGASPRCRSRRQRRSAPASPGRHLHLQVPRDQHPLRARAQADDPPGVLLRLHAEERHVVEHPAEQAADEAVAAVGPVGDAPVGEDGRHTGAAEGAQEVRPELRLERDEARGSHPVHGAPDGAGEVEREREA